MALLNICVYCPVFKGVNGINISIVFLSQRLISAEGLGAVQYCYLVIRRQSTCTAAPQILLTVLV